MLSYYF